jgi:hypothetical protein
VGKPTRDFNREDIGVKVEEEFRDRIDSNFLYYYFLYLHQSGVFVNLAHGTLALKNIKLSDIKSIPISFNKNINESVNLLLEYDGSIDGFVYQLEDHFPEIDDYRDEIKKFLVDSGCQKIEFALIGGPIPAQGLSLHDRVIINTNILNKSLEYALYVIFHEVAHQYQYKKYGKDFAIKLYLNEISVEDGYKILKNIEFVADQFAIRKCREFVKLGLLDANKTVKYGAYSKVPDIGFKSSLIQFKNLIKSKKLTDPDEISQLIYNHVMGLLSDQDSDDMTAV